MIRQRFPWLAVLLAVAACGGREAIRPEPSTPVLLTAEQKPTPAPLTSEQSPPEPSGCPDDDFDAVKRCPGPPPAGYGTTLEQPLEWGPYGIGEVGRGRLVCPDGGWPNIVRQGSHAVVVASTSPRSIVPKMDGENTPVPEPADLVDAWLVSCPGRAPVSVFSNIYRCGNPCPPASLVLASPAGEVAYRAAVLFARERKGDLALELMDRALGVSPDNEKYHSYRGIVLMQLRRPEEAVVEFAYALKRDPESVMHALNHIEALEAAGQDEQTARAYHVLLSALAGTHPERPRVQCRHATWLLEHGLDEEALAQAKVSCAAGFAKCCDR